MLQGNTPEAGKVMYVKVKLEVTWSSTQHGLGLEVD